MSGSYEPIAAKWVKDISDIIYNSVLSISIIIGAIWTIYKFGLFREKYPSLEISNGIKYIGKNKDEHLIELNCKIVNKGNVRKWLAPLEFDLLYLKFEDSFVPNEKYLNNEIEFKRMSENHVYWVSPTWHIPFIDGNSQKEFKYLTSIPINLEKLSLFTQFIDFNSKRKAVFYLKNREKFEKRFENWDELSVNEKIDINSKLYKQSDFYYTQFNTSINDLMK